MPNIAPQKLTRREVLKLLGVAGTGLGIPCALASCGTNRLSGADNPNGKNPVHLVGYPDIEDFGLLAALGINTLLVELNPSGDNWRVTYETAIRYGLRLIPIIWNPEAEQSIWQWDEKRNEWQLDRGRYPDSVGANFLGFLKDHEAYFRQTFAIYSFHEPLWHPEKTGPERLKVFYRQVTEEVFPGGSVRVYGEDITMGWNESDECLTGVVDYESHNVYPFVSTPDGRYRPFDVICNCYGPPTNDRRATIQAELACLDERVRRYASAAPARTGRRPEPIVLIQTFVDGDYTDLWNRMPSAEEMEDFASVFLETRRYQLKGLGWYPYRLVSDNYRACLHTHRFDDSNADRLEVLRRISGKFYPRVVH